MIDYPEGAVRSLSEFLEKSRKQFYLVRAHLPPPDICICNKLPTFEVTGGMCIHMREFAFEWQKTDHKSDVGHLDLGLNFTSPVATLFVFTNYWLAWAYYQRIKNDKN